MEKSTESFQSAEDYLVKKQGVSPDAIKKFKAQGFRHTTMICPSPNERIEYERTLRATHAPEDIEILNLSGDGTAYWVRDKKE